MPLKDDLPSGPCEWSWDAEERGYYTSCNHFSPGYCPEYCPWCNGKIELEEDEE